ncbi:hypothetical protein [Streptomyces longwoodensis]|uniref:hypothetical protein n=1 Tax=Streptomyces longwoodensis TaxID=68231 RepID=UPI003800BB82
MPGDPGDGCPCGCLRCAADRHRPHLRTGQAQPLIALVLTARPRNRAQLGRDRLNLVLLHTPERAHPGDRPALHRAILDAFADLEKPLPLGA